jgi:hypothetical protein
MACRNFLPDQLTSETFFASLQRSQFRARAYRHRYEELTVSVVDRGLMGPRTDARFCREVRHRAGQYEAEFVAGPVTFSGRTADLCGLKCLITAHTETLSFLK